MGDPKIEGEREGVGNLEVEGDLNYEIEGEREGVGSLDVEGNLEYEIRLRLIWRWKVILRSRVQSISRMMTRAIS